jgi:hypothetical protein
MITVPITANINSVDAPVGATLNTVNVDLRQQPTSGGFFTAEIASTAVSAGSATLPAVIEVIESGSGTVEVNIDFRQQPNSGGFMTTLLSSALVSYAGAAAPVAPTTGTAVSGALAARNETFETTYVDANGNESPPSPTTAQAVALNSVATVASPAASTGATKYNVYGVITGGTPTLQNASPIALATPFQEASTGLLTTGRAAPVNSTLVTGPCNVNVAQGGAFAQGAATLTITQ